ncbi:MAG: hypothetical protein ABH833_03930 [Parcubacteria group bacterium]
MYHKLYRVILIIFKEAQMLELLWFAFVKLLLPGIILGAVLGALVVTYIHRKQLQEQNG